MKKFRYKVLFSWTNQVRKSALNCSAKAYKLTSLVANIGHLREVMEFVIGRT